MSGVYYNDNDPQAAAWLRELVSRGLIADGEVDERSILDVQPNDLKGFTQCHFFAGIGGWSYALRLAGVPDNTNLWTGSPPCQPFSNAGRREGKNDDRHLAPNFVGLVRSCRPRLLFGEQVASSDVFGKAAKASRNKVARAPEWAWLDDLSDRLEAAHYAVGASDIPSAGVGAPHIRQRTFFGAVRLADTYCERQPGSGEVGRPCDSTESENWQVDRTINDGRRGRLADTDGGYPGAERKQRSREHGQQQKDGGAGGLANYARSGRREERADGGGRNVRDCPEGLAAGLGAGGEPRRPRPTNGFWGTADWLFCRDDKWRPVESGTQPMAHGLPARMGRLRGYGNAINPYAAAAFIEAFLESL